MANIKYEVSRWDVSCCHHTHPTEAGYAESVILGITATDQESGKSAFKSERISISPCVELGQFEKESEKWIENQIGSRGWYLELQSSIASQLKAPEPAPAGRTKPDFDKMTIGEGYSDLPSEEKEEEGKAEEETPAGAKTEAKPAAKKKAKAAKQEEPKEEESKEESKEG